jgi:hypothetical protein
LPSAGNTTTVSYWKKQGEKAEAAKKIGEELPKPFDWNKKTVFCDSFE